MSYFKTSKTLPYAPDDVFGLVADIAAYPNFIKWITAMRVRDEAVLEDGRFICTGDAVVGFKGFTERFTTKVTSDPIARTVRAQLVHGPFRKLLADWMIEPQPCGGCVCTLAIDYEFSNPLVRMLAAANENMAADKIMSAYMSEAKRRFSARAPAPNPIA